MPTFAYLKDYGVEVSPAGIYSLTFSIPNNCNYTSASTGTNSYCLTIALNPGQHVPSTTFMLCSEDYSSTTGNIRIEFSQPDQLGRKRPIVILEN